VRWFPSVLFLLVRLGLSLCAVAFVLDNLQGYYAPMSDFAGTGRPPAAPSGGVGTVLDGLGDLGDLAGPGFTIPDLRSSR
jgi:hypothetical protein